MDGSYSTVLWQGYVLSQNRTLVRSALFGCHVFGVIDRHCRMAQGLPDLHPVRAAYPVMTNACCFFCCTPSMLTSRAVPGKWETTTLFIEHQSRIDTHDSQDEISRSWLKVGSEHHEILSCSMSVFVNAPGKTFLGQLIALHCLLTEG